jgi:hypothetical protein
MGLVATETLSTNVPAAKNPVIRHDQFDLSVTLKSTPAPPVTKTSAKTYALVGGALTIDLTALSGTSNEAVDGTGLKVQAIKIKNTGTNAMTFVQGAANDYELVGATFSFTLLAGQHAMFYLNDAAPDVGATDSDIDVSGTGTETFEMILVMG